MCQALTRFEGGSKQDVDATRKHVLAATAELENVCQSAGLAEGEDVSAAFNATVNRGLMAPTPPRTVPVRCAPPPPSATHATTGTPPA